MLKKFIVPIIVFLIGIGFYIAAALFKILHWGLGVFNAATFLIIASVIQLIAIILAIIQLLKVYRSK
jgi:hypothetical protein|tara:strand:- start:12227 stop:12427 length:201 start_codon:yes stop_codon:yes gene_type:complete